MSMGPRILPAVILILIASAMISSGDVAAPSWPQFRGADRNGISKEVGLLKSWPDGGPRLVWTFDECGKGYSAVTLADGMILTAGAFTNGAHITALDLDGKALWRTRNGDGKWKVPVGKEKWAKGYGGARSTPTILNNRVFHMGVSGRLTAFELASGAEIWSLDLKDRFKGIRNEWGYSESVLVVDDRVYCLPGGSDGFMVCLDGATGRTVWTCKEIPDKKASNSSCVLLTIDGVEQIVTMTTVLVVGVRASDGKMLWQFRHANRFRENCEIPQYVDGVLVVSSGYQHGSEGHKIEKADDGKWTVKQIWRQNQADNLHGGPIILDGYIYAAGYDRKGAFCLDLETGVFKWRHKPMTRSSYACADGLLYRLGESGVMALEKPSPESYELISSFTIPSAKKALALTHPVICGGKLYIRHQHYLYCYDINAAAIRGLAGATD
jgi:outer membrane protein assembly factor BamB